MGYAVEFLKKFIEKFSKGNVWGLRIGGLFITITIILISSLCGWFIERIALSDSPLYKVIGSILLIFGMASCIASKSLRKSIFEVLSALGTNSEDLKLQSAREKLSHIVGRDVWEMNRPEILRATAETASENSIDGIFAPLFWMFIGAALLALNSTLPGPLALGFAYKASSTIDSMIGYKHGHLLWLGMVGAKFEDFLTWLPCRIVLLTLPLISKPFNKIPAVIKAAWDDGSKDPSPNSGISEAIFAHCTEIQMGGLNTYKGKLVEKPLLAKESDSATSISIKRLLKLSLKLELSWLLAITIFALIFSLI